MKAKRLLGGALAVAFAGATALSAPTQAVVSGSGSSTITTSLLSIDLGGDGSLLGVSLVSEEATTTNGASPSALARLHTASLSSDTLSALNLSGPSVEVASSSSPQTVTAPSLDLAAPAGQALPGGIVAGRVVPKPVSAAVDAAGAHASAGAAIEGLSLAGGLISAGTISSVLSSDSLSTDTSASRSVTAENLRVLDLGALLAGLGIDPTQLSLSTLSKLVASLDLDVAGIDVDETLAGTVNELSGQIETLRGLLPVSAPGVSAQQLAAPEVPLPAPLPTVPSVPTAPVDPVDTVGTVVDTVDEALEQVEVPVNVPVNVPIDPGSLTDPIKALLDQVDLGQAPTLDAVVKKINELQGQLTAVLDSTIDTLDAAPLLSIDSVQISVSSKATDAVGTSLADVSAKVTGVHVGELGSLGGVDLTDLTAPTSIAEVDALVAAIEAEIGKVLGEISPALAGIVDITLFEETESVTSEGSTVKSVAGLTAITARVTPPADLVGIVAGVVGEVGLGDILDSVGLDVPVVEGAMALLNQTLAGVTGGGVTAQQVPAAGALAQGVVVRLGTLSATSTFTPTPAPASVPGGGTPAANPSVPAGGAPSAPGAPSDLPRTGSSLTFVLLAFGALLIATGLGLPQWAEVVARPSGSRRTN